MATTLEGGEWSASRPNHTLPPGKTRYPLYRRLGGPQSRSGKVRKISPPTGIRSPDRPARSQSLYRLSYLAHWLLKRFRTNMHGEEQNEHQSLVMDDLKEKVQNALILQNRRFTISHSMPRALIYILTMWRSSLMQVPTCCNRDIFKNSLNIFLCPPGSDFLDMLHVSHVVFCPINHLPAFQNNLQHNYVFLS
jgi:hypothetical protein